MNATHTNIVRKRGQRQRRQEVGNTSTTSRGGHDKPFFESFEMPRWGGFRLPAEPENARG